MNSEKHEEMIGPSHPISELASQLSEYAYVFAGTAGISKWDVCVAYANAIAQILASSKDMPRDKAFERINDLGPLMQKSYDLAKQGTLPQ